MERTELSCVDKSGWPDGPWRDEPDRIQWTQEDTGLTCLIVRHPARGHLCGYVAVPAGHPWHGRQAEDAVLLPAAHWEVSYACPPQPAGGNPLAVACDDPGVWWFGFHCAHVFDLVPGDRSWSGDAVYRHAGYAGLVCAVLAVQLAAIAARHAEIAAQAAFTYPECGKPSGSLAGAAAGYCGNCHDWTGTAAPDRAV